MAKKRGKARDEGRNHDHDEKRRKGRKGRKARRKQRLRDLEAQLDALAREQRRMAKRLRKLGKRLADSPPTAAAAEAPFPPPYPFALPPTGPAPRKRAKRDEPGRRRRDTGGLPPWARGTGPIVSLEVPLETEDPTAPLWATVAARLPEEITAVGDDGRIVRYRYSAVGSTPQAPRYRHLHDPESPAPEGFER